ncbi:MAG: hypothetical protein J2P37_08185 [Ktedonobacteraceae bacterium]|nr:hypothetical protein [Ktedonobacteraceae bacterium]
MSAYRRAARCCRDPPSTITKQIVQALRSRQPEAACQIMLIRFEHIEQRLKAEQAEKE